MWAFLFSTALILATPTPERDTGVPQERPQVQSLLPTPRGYKKFIRYLTQNGYQIIRDDLPLFVEVKKRQVEGNPVDVASELARVGYEMTGERVKVILRTWGGKYIGEYRPEGE